MFLDPMILVSSNRIFWKMKLSWLKCHGEPLADFILFFFKSYYLLANHFIHYMIL